MKELREIEKYAKTLETLAKKDKELKELQDLKEIKLEVNNTEQNLTEKRKEELHKKNEEFWEVLNEMIFKDYLTIGKQGLILGLVRGNSITEVSKELGMSRTTVYKWLENPKIKEVVRLLQEERFLSTFDILRNLNLRAVKELVIQFKSSDSKRRLEVAKYVIDRNIKMLEWEKKTLELTEEKQENESKRTKRLKMETNKVKKGL